ncbi:C40 family peptidase [Heyndrickxia vini]|uniref:C40 family peptidase n=1 Tax=Heyndrickxia vini TaxID=1476025 RepID=A0ABX7E1X9_9BACI|nr:C40 family peptidase [Heyndrickxia vini]QQZ09728.1 C40 family peptidase [Heyndrickxia vini]
MNLAIRKPRFLVIIAAIFALSTALLFVPFSKASASINYGEEVVSVAKLYEGEKFKMGGTTPKGFDASGYTQYVYKNAATKLKIPRTSADQYKIGKAVKLNQLQNGDLVYYATGTKKGKVSFVAIYIGDGKFIGATSKGVTIVKMSDKYWKDRFVGAKRIIK